MKKKEEGAWFRNRESNTLRVGKNYNKFQFECILNICLNMARINIERGRELNKTKAYTHTD